MPPNSPSWALVPLPTVPSPPTPQEPKCQSLALTLAGRGGLWESLALQPDIGTMTHDSRNSPIRCSRTPKDTTVEARVPKILKCAKEPSVHLSASSHPHFLQPSRTSRHRAFNPLLKGSAKTQPRQQLKATGLIKCAACDNPNEHNPVMLAPTMDGAVLTDNYSQFTGGMRDIDARCIDILSEDMEKFVMDWQSPRHCTVHFTILGKDSKDACNAGVCKEFLDWTGKKPFALPAGVDMEGEMQPEMRNFCVTTPQDMKSHWVTTGLGGASSVCFCLCCATHRSDKANCKVGDCMCDRCKKHSDIARCYCAPVNDGDHLQKLQFQLNKHAEEADDEHFGSLRRIRSDSFMEHKQDAANKESRETHIDFKPSTRREKGQHLVLLLKELKHRCSVRKPDELWQECQDSSTLEERQAAVKKVMKRDEDLWEHRNIVKRQDFVKWFTCDQAVPCMLHLNMRVCEKTFYALLVLCWDRHQDGDDQTRKKFLEAVESHMNEVVLRRQGKSHRNLWSMPLKKEDKTKLAGNNFTGTRAKEVVNGMKGLIDVCFDKKFDQMGKNPAARKKIREDNERCRDLCAQLMNHWLPLTVLFAQTEDFDEDEGEIDSFHRLCNLFMHTHCATFSHDCNMIINCTHVVGAGHLTHYLSKHKNLSKFQQQGWEALNRTMKKQFYRNTNKGGSEGSGDCDMTNGKPLKGVAHLCQRRNMWFFGIAEQYFTVGPAIVSGLTVGNEASEPAAAAAAGGPPSNPSARAIL